MDFENEIRLQRMRDFIPGKNDGFVLKEVRTEEVGKSVVLFEDFESRSVWHFSIFNHFNTEIVKIGLA